jgi:hypothetical protein
MKRRTTLRACAGGLATLLAGAACRPPQSVHSVSGPARAVAPAPDAPALHHARQLGLTLADLPDGFRLTDELAPSFSVTGLEDPYGRLTAYSATFAAPAGVPAVDDPPGEVVSSVNTYASAEHARRAFAAWQAALPRAYLPVQLDLGLAPEDGAAFAQDRACMVGFRHRNVFASIWVGRQPVAAGAPGPAAEAAARFARMVVKRIDAGVR